MQPSGRDYPVTRSDEQWRAELDDDEFAVLRQGGTERPFTHPFEHDATVCVYACRACGAELFRSETKFDAHSRPGRVSARHLRRARAGRGALRRMRVASRARLLR
jgi:hypothetical protein